MSDCGNLKEYNPVCPNCGYSVINSFLFKVLNNNYWKCSICNHAFKKPNIIKKENQNDKD